MHLQRAFKYTFCKTCGERNSYHLFTWTPRKIVYGQDCLRRTLNMLKDYIYYEIDTGRRGLLYIIVVRRYTENRNTKCKHLQGQTNHFK